MAIWKLAEHGPVAITVTEISESEGKFGPQFAVDGVTADGEEVRLYVTSKGLKQQLERLKLDVDSALGQQLYFEQVVKDGTRFTNISRGTGGPAKVAAPGASPAGAKPAAAAPAAPARVARMTPAEAAKVYAECVDLAMATLGARLEQAEVPFDGAVIQSAAATLFIACK
jgi:hypothetical protein